jgi:hypothetical protein
MSLLQPDDARRGDFHAGFGMTDESASDLHGRYFTKAIAQGASRNVTYKPRVLGVLDMDSYLPISMCPGSTLVLTLTFSDDPTACCNTSNGYGSNYNVSEMIAHVDVLSVDAAMLTNLSQYLYSGNALQMQFPNYHTAFFSLLSGSAQITHSRSSSRLNSVMVTFAKTDVEASGDKAQTNLVLPTSNKLKARLVIGEKRFPGTEDMQGSAYFYRRLMQQIRDHTPAITRQAYESGSFIAAFNLEASPTSQHSGISTNTAPLNVFLESVYVGAGADTPNTVFLHTSSDCVLEVTARGVVVGV